MRVALIAWLIFLVWLSLSPFEVKAQFHSMGRYHDWGHVLAFTVMSILLVWNGRSLIARLGLSLTAITIALAMEWLERMKFHNPYEWSDVYTDSGGILLGLFIVTATSHFAVKGVKGERTERKAG